MHLKVAVLSRVDSCKQRGHVIVNNRHVTINRNVVILITYVMRMLYKNKVWGLWRGQHRPESRAVTMMDSVRPPTNKVVMTYTELDVLGYIQK